MGPVEILVIGFPGSQFNGEIIPALTDLVERDIISIIDALMVTREQDGSVNIVELEEDGSSSDVAALAALVADLRDLISDEDVEDLVSNIEPGSSAAILAFEHTWARPLKQAIVGSGGVLLSEIRVPGAVIDEVLAAVDALA